MSTIRVHICEPQSGGFVSLARELTGEQLIKVLSAGFIVCAQTDVGEPVFNKLEELEVALDKLLDPAQA